MKYSALLQLDYWDPTRFLVIDSLHAFWLGVCKSYMKQLRDMKWKTSPSKELKIMQARLDSMRVPADVCRILNKWSANMSGLTGQQIKAFVSCFSIAVYDGFLDDVEHGMWLELVSASRLLSQTVITDTQINQVLLACPFLSFVAFFCLFLSLFFLCPSNSTFPSPIVALVCFSICHG